MRIFKARTFSKWAAKASLPDGCLRAAVKEMESGLVDAHLGGFLYKKRVAIHSGGKRGGTRTLLAYKSNDKAFFVYGYAKKLRANIKKDEEKALKLYARELMSLDDEALLKAMKFNVLIEVD